MGVSMSALADEYRKIRDVVEWSLGFCEGPDACFAELS
jgi:hypothetical protein